MTQREWLADIGEAADDLGYGILQLEPGRVELQPLRGGADRDRIVIESIFLSGAYLRQRLLVCPHPGLDRPVR